MIEQGDLTWKKMVPDRLAKIIVDKIYFTMKSTRFHLIQLIFPVTFFLAFSFQCSVLVPVLPMIPGK